MSATETFQQRWHRVAAEDAKADNSVDSYWSHIKSFYRFLGRGAATWTGRDWEAFVPTLLLMPDFSLPPGRERMALP